MPSTTDPPATAVELSVILPVYNEEANLGEIYSRLSCVLEQLSPTYEILFVDDGSRDGSVKAIRDLHAINPRVKLVRLARNFGHQTAVSAGIDYAAGQAVVIMDADLQDPPEVLPQFVAKLHEGYEVVYAIRQKRKENFLKRTSYALFYRILQRLAAIDIPLDSGDFCVMDRRMVDQLKAMPERNRFVRGLRAWAGYRQIGLEYERDRRYAGEVKYTMRKLTKLALDGLISFSHVPLRMATLMGFCVSAAAFFLAGWTLYKKIVHPGFIAGFSTIVIVMTLLGGVQLLTLGIIGEYIGRIFDEVKQRPLYTVQETIGIDASK